MKVFIIYDLNGVCQVFKREKDAISFLEKEGFWNYKDDRWTCIPKEEYEENFDCEYDYNLIGKDVIECLR